MLVWLSLLKKLIILGMTSLGAEIRKDRQFLVPEKPECWLALPAMHSSVK